MFHKGFEGWYFKHQKGEDMVAFIPGMADSGPFIQMMSNEGARLFDIPDITVDHGVIYAGNCVFSQNGCKIDLPNVTGELSYHQLTPLQSDIMGPFRFLPMECSHGVLSMDHTLIGSLIIDGKAHDFNGGKGYIEKDSGTSFPQFYQWLQCNDFSEPCSIMVAVAHIPFCGTCFTGCLCAIVHHGHEYRLATYRGIKIHVANEESICLSQGKLLLQITMKPSFQGHSLLAPKSGQMSGRIRESCNAAIGVRLWSHGKLVIDLNSPYAAYEFVPKALT